MNGTGTAGEPGGTGDAEGQMNQAGLTGACVILAVCFAVGAPGNLLVVWTIVKHVKQRSHTVLLILHLAVADLLVLVTLPLWIYSLARSWVFGQVTCKAMVYIIHVCMYASVFLITVMSVERFLAIRYPFASASWKRKQALKKVVLAVWTVSILLSVPVIWTQVLGGETGEEQCLYRIYELPEHEAAILLLESLLGFVLPLSVLAVCYGCLFSRIASMSLRSKRKSTMLIAAVVLLFGLCWMPHHVANALSLVLLTLEKDSPTANTLQDVVDGMVIVAGALAFASNAVNPVLYVFAARNFRDSLRETGIHKLFRHLSSGVTGDGTKEMSFVSRRQSSQTNISRCSIEESKSQIIVDVCNNATTHGRA
ncbi:leukotriene B4 receptor 1 [Brachyhypopomus gauderio]|uniref:leukotriene B4 receptor 1 n=1 Tax=Brachyhypopomus gauderio TaxID=698409 RepID=UPI004042C861